MSLDILVSWFEVLTSSCGVSTSPILTVSVDVAILLDIKVFLNSSYSAAESKDFAIENIAVWLAGTLTTDTSKSSASFILYPSVSSL